MPEGSDIAKVKYFYNYTAAVVKSVFINGDKCFRIIVRDCRSSSPSMAIEKDSAEVIIENHGGIDFYIAQNKGRLTLWGEDGKYFYQIAGDLSYDEVSMILKNMK